MDNATYDTTLENGTNVYGSDGDKVGSIIGVTSRYIVVEKGFFFPTDYYIPRSAVSGQNDDGIMLNVTKDDALNQGWNSEPTDLNDAGTDSSYLTTTTSSDAAGVITGRDATAGDYPADAADAGYATNTLDAGYTTSTTDLGYTGTGDPTAGAEVISDRQTVQGTATASRRLDRDDDSLTIDVREEELIATKRAEEIGSVRVEKVVTAEERTIDVPVSEERVRVTRRVVDRADTVGIENADAFEETVIDVPLYGEDVDVSKRTRVVGEVEIDKEAVQSTRRVEGTVRREDVEVIDDVDGGVEGVIDNQTAVIDPGTTTRQNKI